MTTTIISKQEEAINKCQEEFGLKSMQDLILSGEVWKFEGAMGRAAMQNLECGACYLPDVVTRDFWGNRIPARSELKPGTKGTLKNSVNFYSDPNNYIDGAPALWELFNNLSTEKP